MKLNAIGCNIFAGGFTAGVSKHFNVLGHLEHDNYGVEVSSLNFPKLNMWVGTETWPKKLNVDFVYSNPPCAVWSMAAGSKNAGGKWKNDPRIARVMDSFSLIERYKPKVWCWESVCAAFARGRSLVDELRSKAHKMGYSTTVLMVDAMYLNTPQTRRRFFLIAHKVKIDWQTPKFKDCPSPEEVLRTIKPDFVPRVPQSFVDLYKQSEDGEDLQDTFNRLYNEKKRLALIKKHGKVVGRPSFLVKRLKRDAPCPTVIGDRSLWHWNKPRPLAMSEVQKLAGFPDNWKWPHRMLQSSNHELHAYSAGNIFRHRRIAFPYRQHCLTC